MKQAKKSEGNEPVSHAPNSLPSSMICGVVPEVLRLGEGD